MGALIEDPLHVFRYPLALFVVSFILLSASAWVGGTFLQGLRARVAELQEDYRMIEGAILTLLGLIIGFAFSMAVGRYDLRKNYEEAEANAIGTEYLRADLLPPADGARVRTLLRDYLDHRVAFYAIKSEEPVGQINAETAKLQTDLWNAVRGPALANPNPVTALAVSGMNDVLNSQGYSQAAWLNVIPLVAWALMYSIAVCATILVGMAPQQSKGLIGASMVLPFVLSIAFFLIADIDSPRLGLISVTPQNLQLLQDSLGRP
jgi:hypothetical protein